MISAIVDFAWKHSTPSLKKVKVVIFLSELLNVFYDNMKKRENSASPVFQSTFFETACKMFFFKKIMWFSLISLSKCLDINAQCFTSFRILQTASNNMWEKYTNYRTQLIILLRGKITPGETGIAKEQEEDRSEKAGRGG